MTIHDIPALNATLNGIATVLITAGFVLIKRGNREAHRKCMLGAAAVSALFLAGYLTYHSLRHGYHTPFGGTGRIRTVYLTILWTHIPLAALIAFSGVAEIRADAEGLGDNMDAQMIAPIQSDMPAGFGYTRHR